MTTTDFKPKQRADRDVTCFTEFTGLRNDIPPERFDRTDLVVANNVVLNKARSLQRRAGSTLRRAGAAHSLWAAGADALVGAGPTLLRLDPALVPTQLTNALSGAPISYARAGDNVYFSNGHDTGVALASSVRSWGLAVPPLLATSVAGDLTPGRYLVSATYVRLDGQESGAADVEMIEVELGESVMLSVPPSADSGVTTTRFYMSTPDEEVLYHVGSTNDGVLFIPTAADIAAMNEPLTTQFMGPPPAGQLVTYFKGRMFVAVGDVLYPSQPFAYELFDLRDYIQLDAPITMLAPLEDKGESAGLFIGTTTSTGVLMGASPEDFAYVAKADYGVVQGALTFVDGALFMEGAAGARLLPAWLSKQGICVGMPGMDIMNVTRERFTFSVGDTGAALFDPVSNTFVGVSAGCPAVAMHSETLTLTTFTEYGYNSFARVGGKSLGASAAGLFELAGDDDNGLPINATITLPPTDFGSSFVKAIDRLYVGYRSQADMVMQAVIDGDASFIYTLPVSAQPGLATQRIKLGRGLSGRYWQFTINNLDGTGFTLDTVDVKVNRLERRINGRA